MFPLIGSFSAEAQCILVSFPTNNLLGMSQLKSRRSNNPQHSQDVRVVRSWKQNWKSWR